jgi:DNA-binding MarR family transcriptional regulator
MHGLLLLMTILFRSWIITDTELENDAIELHGALSDLVRVYQFRDRERICCHDISVTQCYALNALIRRGDLPLTGLAAELYLDKSTTSRVVDSLVNKGYVKRSSDPSDGRALRISVTSQGKKLHKRIELDLVDEMKKLVADIDPDIRQATVRLVARLARAATDRFSREPGSCACE